MPHTGGPSFLVADVHGRPPQAMMQPTYDRIAERDMSQSLPRRVFRNFAAQDWLLTIYFLGLFFALSIGNGPNRDGAFRLVLFDFVMLCVGFLLTRGEILGTGLVSSLLYRLTLFIPILMSYFQMRTILPAVTTRTLDAQIYAFDMSVFHYEPSIAWDQYVTPMTTEWFAFFYFGYFFILILHTMPFLLGAKDGILLRHFSLGIFTQFAVSHTLYLVVPGWGPYHELKFNHELVGGTFWNLVVETVRAGSAEKDIFPSLHTGAPLFFALFAFVHRKHLPFKYTWPVMAFCVTQIIGATMFLRWHYLIDIFAGITLACFSTFVGLAVVRWEEKRRETRGVQPVFEDAPLSLLFAKLRKR